MIYKYIKKSISSIDRKVVELLNIQFDDNDNQLSNFSSGAKKTLKKQLEEYVDYVIQEANLIEQGFRENDANTEIISSYVIQACRKSTTKRLKSLRKKLIWAKIVSSLSALFCGIIFDISEFQQSTRRLLLFILCLIVTCVSTVLSFVWEGGE